MQLELDSDDVDVLKRLLERYVGDLRMEISNTENFDMRNALKADEERLKEILRRLSS